MKRALTLLAGLCLVTGCTTFTVTQTDESPEERTITSKITAVSVFSSAQNIAHLKALQTDKTQSFGSEAIGQQGATNTVATLQALARILELLRPAP